MYKSISAQNFMGHEAFAYPLASMNLIAGPNDTGKSAILRALVLAVTGEDAQLGKSPKGLWALCSGDSMQVATELDDDALVSRTWTQSPKTGAISKVFTGIDFAPKLRPINLDLDLFVGSGQEARIKMVFDAADIKEFKPEELRQEIITKHAPPAPEVKDENGKVIPSDPNSLPIVVAKALEAQTDAEKENGQIWLDAALTRVAAEINKTNATITELKKTATGTTGLKKADIDVNEGHIRERAEALAKLRDALAAERGALREREKTADERAMAHTNWQRRYNALAAKLAVCTARDKAVVQPELSEAKTRRQELSSAYETKRVAYREVSQAAAQLETARASEKRQAEDVLALSDAAGKIESLRAELQGITKNEELSKLIATRDALRDEQTTLNANRAPLTESIPKLEKRLADLQAAECCPTCKAKGTNWKDEAVTDVQERLTEKRAALEAIDDRLAVIAVDYPAAMAKAATLKTTVDNSLANVRAKLTNAETAARKFPAEKSRLDNLASERQKLADKLQFADITAPVPPDLTLLDDYIQSLQAEFNLAGELASLAQLKASEPAQPEETDFESAFAALDEQSAAHNAEAEAIAELEQQAQNQRAHAQTLQLAEDARGAAEARVAILKLVLADVKKKRDDLVKKTWGKITKQMQPFVEGILPSPLEYFINPENPEAKGDLGCFKNGSWVTLKAMGTTYLTVTCVAIQAVLSQDYGVIMVDELGRLDENRKRQFLKNVAAVIKAGGARQFFGIDVNLRGHVEWNREDDQPERDADGHVIPLLPGLNVIETKEAADDTFEEAFTDEFALVL